MEHIYDVVIIGGGPAGLSAGVYAGRAKLDTVIIEKGAGLGIDIPDEAYIKAGCKIGSREEVYGSDLVVRIKEPNFEEIEMMRPSTIIMSMMHIRCRPKLDEALHKQKLIVIPLENIKDPVGRRKIDAVEDSGTKVLYEPQLRVRVV